MAQSWSWFDPTSSMRSDAQRGYTKDIFLLSKSNQTKSALPASCPFTEHHHGAFWLQWFTWTLLPDVHTETKHAEHGSTQNGFLGKGTQHIRL